MTISPELMMDCFLAWRNRRDTETKSELVLIFSDTPAAARPPGRMPVQSQSLRDAATRFEALRPEGTIWIGPGDEAYRVRSVKLVSHGAVLARIERDRCGESDDAACGVGLSKREAEVFRCLAEGRNHKEIARLLFISSHTARKHIENIYAKLKVCNRIEAINKVRGLQSRVQNTANFVAAASSTAGTN